MTIHRTGAFVSTLLVAVLIAVSSGRASADEPQAAETRDVPTMLRGYLFDAARAGILPMLQDFIDAGYDLNQQDERGYTAVILAAYHGQADALNLLLKAGADPCIQDRRGNTALMGAIFKGEMTIARTLIKADCVPDQRNGAGQTPAMYAALFGRIELLGEMTKRGADLNATDSAGNSAASLVRGEIRTR